MGGKKVYVRPYPVLSNGWRFGFEHDDGKIARPNMEKEIAVLANEVADDPNTAAYALIEKLFFGVPPNKFPYVKEEGGRMRVDVESFSRR